MHLRINRAIFLHPVSDLIPFADKFTNLFHPVWIISYLDVFRGAFI